MGTSLSGTQISATYPGILKSTDNAILNATLRTITDGLGNDTALQVSTAGVKSTGTMEVTGALTQTGAAALASTLSVAGASTVAALAASGAVTGAGFNALFASPPAIGGTAPAAVAATTVTASTPIALASGGTSAATAVLARCALNKGATPITDAATIATDASLGNVFTCTLGGNRTLGAPTNLAAGATYIWRFTQDGSGSRTLAYNAVFKFPGGLAPVLTTAAGSIDILSGLSDGTNVYCTFVPDLR